MPTAPIVLFDAVSKKFQRGERHDSLRDLLPSLAKGLLCKKDSSELGEQEFWALRDVSFEVRAGQALGIIGPNGAGKSTVLKLLTKIMRPTRGVTRINGRTGALIEVSAGFHPDLTGRENVYLQAAIMGMKRPEVERQFDDIVDFAGVADFIDTPVKRYSSGMNARLGFSIAAHLNPAALIIDEVLSVGDMSFQQRCFDRMLKFKRDGVAIVFVSHNLQAVAMLCDSAMFLSRGVVHSAGATGNVLEQYASASAEARSSADGVVSLVRASLTDPRNAEAGVVQPGTPLRLDITAMPRADVTDLTFGFLAYRTTDNLLVYDGNVTGEELGIQTLRKDTPISVQFNFLANLTRGQYKVEVHIYHNATQTFVMPKTTAGIFGVEETRTYAGIADLALRAVVSSHELNAYVQ